MPLACLSCGAFNDDAADTCFTCGRARSGITQGTVIANRYEILKPLGRGGMGMVYKAHDRDLDEIVALKLLRSDVAQSPEMGRRFRSEIKLARKVRHPNVCAIHEYGQIGSLQYIAMEYVEGADLKHELRRRGGLPPAEAYDVAIQLAEGLQAVHEVGVIHRDLKTPNIMRDAHGVLRLMDFGIAKMHGGATSGETATGQIVGTPEYMSPEHCRGEKIDSRSDIYALGVVLFEIFTGDVPFRGDTPISTLFKQIQEPPPLAGNLLLPPDLLPILHKALAKSRDERYPSAREVADALRNAHGRLPPHPRVARTAPASLNRAERARPLAPAPDETTPMATPLPGIADPSVGRGDEPRGTVSPAVRGAVAAAVVGIVVLGVALFLAPRERVQEPRSLVQASRAKARTEPVLPPTLGQPPSTEVTLSARPAPVLAMPSLLAPAAQARLTYPDPQRAVTRLRWSTIPRAAAYHVVVGTNGDLVRPDVEKRRWSASTIELRGLAAGTYTWRVAGIDGEGREGPFSQASHFTVAQREVGGPSAQAPAEPRAGPTPALPLSASPSPGARDAAPANLSGLLRLAIRPYAEVSIDGRPVGITPLGPLTLAPGGYTVSLSNPGFHMLQRKVTVEAGKTTVLDVDLTFEAFPK